MRMRLVSWHFPKNDGQAHGAQTLIADMRCCTSNLALRNDLILIPSRWPTVESIQRNRPNEYPIDGPTLEAAQRDFRKLSMETAQRTVRFWQLHNRIEK